MLLSLLTQPQQVPIKPVVALIGPESWVRRQLRRDLVERALPPSSFRQLNCAFYDAGEADLEAVLQLCRDYPCFSPHRVVGLREIAKLSASEAEALSAYVQQPVDTTLLILEDSKLDGRYDWVKTLKKRAYYLEIPEASRVEARQWVFSCFEKAQKQTDVEVVERLLDWVGLSFEALYLAVEQCCLYVGAQDRVSLHDVERLLVKVTDENVFALVDAMFAKTPSGLHAPLARLLESGEAPLRLLALIYRHLSLLLVLKHEGRSAAAAAFKIPPGLLSKYERQLRQHAEQIDFSLYDPLARTDLQLKSSALPPALVLKHGIEDLTRSLGL